MSHIKTIAGLALMVVLLLLLLLPPELAHAPDSDPVNTIVLSDPGDPYYPLAEELATSAGLPLTHTWADAVGSKALNILWVTAPESLSDPVMMEAGMALKASAERPAVGIITGASMASARALWQRGKQVEHLTQDAYLYIANGEHPSTGNVEPNLTVIHLGADEPRELTPASLSSALQQANYLTFSGHGGSKYLRISDNEKVTVQTLPDLPPLVVGTASCQTMRPWEEGSIALGFVDRGAAAYAGFVYSPNSGYLPGDYSGLPFRYTWPGFTIGRVVALQNRATLQSYANFPFYYLLGDARISFNDQPPYTVLSDQEQNGWRVLSYAMIKAGLVPVRIPGGADYGFVEIPGAGAAADSDIFFNARVQVMNAQGDKYILFDHPGGNFSIRLRRTAPWYWVVTRPLLDSFDDVLLFTPQNGGGELMIAIGVLMFLIGSFRAWRQRRTLAGQWLRLALTVLGIGLAAGTILSAYAWLRLPYSAITTKPLYFIPSLMIGAAILAMAGALLFRTARRWPGKVTAVLVPALPALLPGLFMAASMAFINVMAANRVGASIYGYRSALITLPAAVVIMAVMWGLYRAASGTRRKTHKILP